MEIKMSKGKCKNLFDDGTTCCTSGQACIGAFDCPYYVDAEAAFEGWLCVCGHFEESDLHCSCCGAEPPWGCDCDFCANRKQPEEIDVIELNSFSMEEIL
jgi:hypothetical protein